MSPTTKKLTLKEVQERVKEILARRVRSPIGDCKLHWVDPEHSQGLIDKLREDVIQAIAKGSKVPYALTRAIANLPRIQYGKVTIEPPPVAEVAASFARSFNRLGTQLQEITKVVASSTYGKVKPPAMTSEQAYAIREFLDTDSNEPLRYPPGMSPSELREAFDALLVRYEKLTTAIANAYNELNSNPEPPDYDRPGSCLSDR